MAMQRPGTEVQMYGDSENGYVARNPATGKLERVVEGYDMNAGDGGWYTYWFESDPDKPADAKYMKFPNSNSSWDKFTEQAVPVGLAAIATMGMGAGAAGAAGGTATGAGIDASTGLFAGESAMAGAGTYGTVGGGATGLGGAAAAGGTALGGGSGSAANGGGMSGFDLGGGLNVDEFGNITGGSFEGGPGTPGAGDFYDPMGGGVPDWLAKAPAFLKSLMGGTSGGLGDVGNGLGNFDLGGLLPSGDTARRMVPGAMALAYALKQPGLDVGQLNAILGSLGGNQDAIVRAATDPVQANIAAGYGDLLQSQSKRGIRGSSFGATDIGNYLATTGRSLGNTAANAAEGSLALQGGLATNIAALKNQGQQIKNGLFGRAFDVLGRGLNPGGYGSTINIGGGNGTTGTAPGAPGGSAPTLPLSSLLRLGSGLWGDLKGLFGGGAAADTAGAGDLIDFGSVFA